MDTGTTAWCVVVRLSSCTLRLKTSKAASATGFRPGSFMSAHGALSFAASALPGYTDALASHLTVTSSALLSLTILRDNFKRLDRAWPYDSRDNGPSPGGETFDSLSHLTSLPRDS
ncbi:hypothetical protein K488DRAFT_92692 [Vararia minispora EC-137]|uniref:Uncharacterized protein n=1 Tax=Vararia minispora EC-137 TaxID=1314806 RepID=A0ACB8Q3T6_9AGAM|nr:hypothetical protein K488DRAFT_92692 [Vararia minispora EC-137]